MVLVARDRVDPALVDPGDETCTAQDVREVGLQVQVCDPTQVAVAALLGREVVHEGEFARGVECVVERVAEKILILHYLLLLLNDGYDKYNQLPFQEDAVGDLVVHLVLDEDQVVLVVHFVVVDRSSAVDNQVAALEFEVVDHVPSLEDLITINFKTKTPRH